MLINFFLVAIDQFGYVETGVNNTKFGDWYGMNGEAWCIMFISWCAEQSGILGSVVPRAAHAFYMKSGYKKGNYRERESGYIPKETQDFTNDKETNIQKVFFNKIKI